MSSDSGGAFLDGKVARGLAVLVFLGCFAVLGIIHRDDLFPESQAGASGAEDFFGACFAKRKADIANMEKQGVVKPRRPNCSAPARRRCAGIWRARRRRGKGSRGAKPRLIAAGALTA